ncbi:acyl-CoA dehydrogenase [Pendulispora brunnea]|uniref:Acyl-CoA dehydrogenase n=1 Tax=Pendulispora brunnea TaxID=2905690 RepID=A0ABZ2JYJ8_9BACT
MDFQFTEEQTQLKDLLDRFVAKEYSFDARRKILEGEPQGFSRAVWRKFAELGLLGITLPEEHGGFGGGGLDALIVMEAIGRGLVLEPYLSTVLLCGGLLRDAGNDAQKGEFLPAIIAGERLLAFAHYEPRFRYDLHHIATTAKRQAADYVLSGRKTVVLHGGSADVFIVSARTSGEVLDREGLSLFLVSASAPGVQVRDYRTQDGQRAADVVFENVTVGEAARLGAEGQALAAIERAVDVAIAALCAEAVGAMGALNADTAEYLKTRKQFGVPIGKFQVLQHRMVDMFIHTEQARSMAYLAAVKVHSEDTSERRRALSAAKTLVGQAARFVGQQAVQLHGGMGVTDELAVSHHFKRLTMINLAFGDAEHHLARFSDQLLAKE